MPPSGLGYVPRRDGRRVRERFAEPVDNVVEDFVEAGSEDLLVGGSGRGPR
jgi:hypothetical protein